MTPFSRALALAALAPLALAPAAHAGQPAASLKVTTRAKALTASTTLLTLRVHGVTGGLVRVRANLRPDGAARPSSITRAKTMRIRAGQNRTVHLRLTAAGRKLLGACGVKRLTASVRPLKPAGNVTTFTMPVGKACVAAAPPAQTGTPTAKDGLALRGSRFWAGPTVASGNVMDPSMCTPATCFTYPLRLADDGKRLRVAMDTPSREDNWEFQVLDPGGKVVATQDLSNEFDEEAFLENPKAGLYSVRVMAKGVTDASFRMRAKLEGDADLAHPTGKVPMLPNLKTVPPYEFGFTAPANPANAAYPSDAVNPPLSAGGVSPASCAADETAPVAAGGGGATKCLRLTSGPINIGDGPFDMRFTFAKDSMADPNVAFVNGPIFQAVHYADNSVGMRNAGTYSFHKTHAHFHDDHILDYKLFSLGGATGHDLVPAGVGTKSGFCPADQLFGDWTTFTQEKSGFFGEGDSVSGGNCYSADDGFIGLTKGWGDVYRWQRPGQYVEFGTNGDGFYVVQTSVDILNQIIETDDTDNVSYAYIQVVGDKVNLLERGFGSGPFDPKKVVIHGTGPTSATQG